MGRYCYGCTVRVDPVVHHEPPRVSPVPHGLTRRYDPACSFAPADPRSATRKRLWLFKYVDDTLGVFHTHLVAGFVGGFFTGIFATVSPGPGSQRRFTSHLIFNSSSSCTIGTTL